MSFADKLRNTAQKSVVVNGKTITGEEAVKNVESAKLAAEDFRKYAEEQASFGKTKCKMFIGNGGIIFGSSGARMGGGDSRRTFSFASACSVSGYIRDLLQNDGYSSLSVHPKSIHDSYMETSYWYIRIVASW